MSPRLPRVTGSEVIKALYRTGWYPERQKGSHVHMRHPDRPGMRVTVAVHTGETIKPATLRTILDQAGLTVDQFVELL